MKKNNLLHNKYFILSLIFIISFIVGFLIFKNIAILPYKNPWQVNGLFEKLKYNPANDILKFIIIISFPSIILFFYALIFNKRIKIDCKNKILKANNSLCFILEKNQKRFLFLISIIFIILISLNIPTYHANEKFVDSFHEGETLGTSISYLNGKIPYKNLFFVHGIFEDPLRSVLAFKIFGKSIGSERTLESILKIISYILLFILLFKLFNKNYLYTFISFAILTFTSLSDKFSIPLLILIPPRDITTFLFILSYIYLNNIITKKTSYSKVKFIIISFIFSFIAFSSFSYSIDRGFYLSATFIILFPFLTYFFIKKRIAKYYLLSSFLGLLFSIILLGILLKGNFNYFIDFVFFKMPKYKELMDGRVYPLSLKHKRYIIPLIIIALNLFWLFYKFLISISKKRIFYSFILFIKNNLIEICLFFMSIFFFRTALGRSDWEHITYSIFISYILTIYIIIKYYINYMIIKKNKINKIAFKFLIILIFFISTFSFINIFKKNLITANFPYKIKDEVFIPKCHKNAINFIKKNLKGNENFFTMTSEAIWYYYLDKPSPTRFPVVWFAMPYFYQQQLIEDLKNNNIKIILYKNKKWCNRVDYIITKDRLILVDNYIKNKYRYLKNIDENEIWIKKEK